MAPAEVQVDPAEFDLNNQPPAEFLGKDGCLRYFINSRANRICVYMWPAPNPCKGIITLCHGHGSYIGYDYLALRIGALNTYKGSWVEALNQQGYSVCGADIQGHGRSEGVRCYVENFQHIVDDVLYVVRNCTSMGVRNFPEEVPRYLIGESMGGCVSVLTALQAGDRISGVILLAPMLSLEKVSQKGYNPYLRPLASWVSWFAPQLPCAKTPRNKIYPHLQRAYDLDVNCWHGMTRARNAYEYLRITQWLTANMKQVTFPFLVFHSERDTMCDPDGSKALYMHALSEDKTLRLINEMWHILTKETGNEVVLKEIVEWLDEHTQHKNGYKNSYKNGYA